MTKSKSFLPLFLALPFLFTILVIHLNLPTDAQAKPLAGFTPTPVSPGGGGGGGDNNNDPPDDKPTDYVLVQIDRCDLQCSASTAQADNRPEFQLLASVSNADMTNALFVPLAKPQALPELLLPVQLVHDGSAFIVEGELSDMNPTRFAVPYPGRWQVWLMDNPRFMTAEAVDITGFNLAQLQNQLANGPVSLGTVEADTPEPQWVKCPLACVIEPLSPVETTSYLPETGGILKTEMSLSSFLIISGLNFSLVGLILWAAFRYSAGKHRL